MRPLHSLRFEALVALRSSHFSQIEDRRYRLNRLAFIVHKLIEKGDRLYQSYMERGESRREMWNVLRTLMKKFLFESWAAMLNICLGEEAEASP